MLSPLKKINRICTSKLTKYDLSTQVESLGHFQKGKVEK